MMSKVRYLSSDELIKTEDIGKEEQNPTRILKLCSCKRFDRTTRHDYAVVVQILGNKIALLISNNEDDARAFFHQCLDVIPCFWSPKVPSHDTFTNILSEIFNETVLTKLVELIKERGNTWSVAHMCISLPLHEDTMMSLLASHPFKHYFKSNVHPKGYRLLHLAVEQNSLVACKAIMRCSVCKTDTGLHAEDTDGNTPLEKVLSSQSWACLEYLHDAETEEAETTVRKPVTKTLTSSKVSAEVHNCYSYYFRHILFLCFIRLLY